jgi:hypothetical protein
MRFLAVSDKEVNTSKMTDLVDVSKSFENVVYHCCEVAYVT